MTASAAAAAGYTLAAGPARAQVISTDTKGLKTGEAKVKVQGGEMPVYFARPEKAKNPLVAMESFGLHEYIKDVTRRLAKAGAFAIAPDYYFRAGQDLTKITEIPKLMPIVNAKPDAEFLADLDATVAWAKQQGGNTRRLGIMGFCRGGRTVWQYSAHRKNLKAGVAFYGSLVDPPAQKAVLPKSSTDVAAEVKAPVLALYGEADQGIPMAQVGAMRKTWRTLRRIPNGRSILVHRTASTPITGRATAKKPPRTPGSRCWPISRRTRSCERGLQRLDEVRSGARIPMRAPWRIMGRPALEQFDLRERYP